MQMMHKKIKLHTVKHQNNDHLIYSLTEGEKYDSWPDIGADR